jgi:hypothetical protein
MKTFRVTYRWQDREYSAVVKHFTAHKALIASHVLMMPGAQPFAVEPA